MQLKKSTRLVLTVISVFALLGGGSVAASANAPAADDDLLKPMANIHTYYTVITKKTISSSYTNKSQLLGVCKNPGGKCSISKSVSVTRTIQLSLGAARNNVSAGLGISNAGTVSSSISCTSQILKNGQTFRAYPLGTRYSYQIRAEQWIVERGVKQHKISTKTSGTLYAFNPHPNGVSCTVS
ncbi:hypothetical protein [Agrococcus casei]|uniref:hypothetical protein n=1 Tax=Agrococcus casei TaxID=343512 RepID=UPI001178089A|nr:hypothetical protein [Agrococcus casei]